MGRTLSRWMLDLAILACCAIALLLAPLRALQRYWRRGPVRSLWTGTPILNMAINARAERHLGVDARSLVFYTFYITDAFDHDLSAWRKVPVLGKLLPLPVFLWACLRIDRLHFYCDRGLLPSCRPFEFDQRELRIYRRLGIQVFLWTYGADVRTRSATRGLGEPNCCSECDRVGAACVCDDGRQVRKFREVSSLATAVFSMGDMIHYTPGSRNDLYFWPVDLEAEHGEKYRPHFPAADSTAPLRIVHAPNHRMFKGTRYLEAAVAQLKAEGAALELVLVERVPNARALEIYRTADIIFDQCLVGFHGYFALEGMALGKPVMCFIRRPDLYLLHPEQCPLLNIRVDTLKEDLRRLVHDRQALNETGRRGRRYIEEHFSLEAFALRLDRAYRDLGVAA